MNCNNPRGRLPFKEERPSTGDPAGCQSFSSTFNSYRYLWIYYDVIVSTVVETIVIVKKKCEVGVKMTLLPYVL